NSIMFIKKPHKIQLEKRKALFKKVISEIFSEVEKIIPDKIGLNISDKKTLYTSIDDGWEYGAVIFNKNGFRKIPLFRITHEFLLVYDLSEVKPSDEVNIVFYELSDNLKEKVVAIIKKHEAEFLVFSEKLVL
ncbi:MAG: hypothetical protein KC589_10250, partial [Nanoarchaeota archaeon]|nr:hypothetical protein [Nanoarchaeota archaeon]